MVLEILAKSEFPVYLTRIAELSNATSHAIDRTLKILLNEGLVTKRKKARYTLFTLNDERFESELIREIIYTKDKVLRRKNVPNLSSQAWKVLQITDEITWVKSPKTTIEVILSNLVTLLSDAQISFRIVGEFPASIRRKICRPISSLEIEVFPNLNSIFESLQKFGLENSKVLTIEKESTASGKVVTFTTKNSLNPLRISLIGKNTVNRAKDEIVLHDLRIPIPTLEDIIIERSQKITFNLTNQVELDDLENILATKVELDLPVLISKLIKERISLPSSILWETPPILSKISNEIQNGHPAVTFSR